MLAVTDFAREPLLEHVNYFTNGGGGHNSRIYKTPLPSYPRRTRMVMIVSKLGLQLPHPVQSQAGKAQFYSERQGPEVNLPMNRFMDQSNLQ
ncbi:unnamed protein product [Oncorhynchus mykiss]|uniref:Uncharacterized protein n=1 Tax=Oncorhynchus mykiss TaxID=8022 RepID=A0A060WMC1_ONCMY|nr:unnamed protein product [Oncorhynchus mykiss]